MPILDSIVAGLTCCGIGFVLGLRVAAWIDSPKPLFRCYGCHRDIYPPGYKRLHVGLATYCAECEAKYWNEGAEALRVRWALELVEGSISETLEPK